MGLFGPFIYKTKSGQKFWLHMKEKGRARLYYFSKDPIGALNDLPRGFGVVENPKTGLPFLKRKTAGGFLTRIFGIVKGGISEKKEGVKETSPEGK